MSNMHIREKWIWDKTLEEEAKVVQLFRMLGDACLYGIRYTLRLTAL